MIEINLRKYNINKNNIFLAAKDFEKKRNYQKARRLYQQIINDEENNILDGHHRVAICRELGITDWPRFVRKNLSEDQKREHALSLNVNRRQLSQSEKKKAETKNLTDV